MTEIQHLATLHPYLAARVEQILVLWRAEAEPGDSILLTESVRSLETQQRYYARGATKADGVRFFSFHQFNPGLAVDCLVLRAGKIVSSISDPAWQRYGEIGEQEGLSWGGRWTRLRDGPHLEVPEVERVRLVQQAVGAEADGAWGPATERALAARGVPLRAGKGWARMTLEGWAELAKLPAR